MAQTDIIAGDFGKAEVKIEKTLSLNPDNPEGLLQLVVLRIREGRVDEARRVLKRKYDLGSGLFDFDSLDRLGLVFERAGNEGRATRGGRKDSTGL